MSLGSVFAVSFSLIFAVMCAWAQERPAAQQPTTTNGPRHNTARVLLRSQPGPVADLPFSSRASGWPGFGYGAAYAPWYNGSDLGYGLPYGYSPYYIPRASYLYFYNLYDQEAQRSKQEADEFEASLAREGKLTGPAPLGAFPTDLSPFTWRDLRLKVDGREYAPSASGAPLSLGSGRHTVLITVKR